MNVHHHASGSVTISGSPSSGFREASRIASVGPDLSRVPQSLHVLEKTLGEAEDLLTTLHQRIEGILRPDGPYNPPPASPLGCQPHVSPVAARIEQSRMVATQLCIRIDAILSRIDL